MSQVTITLLFLLFAIVMFMWEKIPLGLTSMIVCVGLVVTRVLDWKTAFSGFIDSNVILFVAMFIVGGALFETGMANKIGGVVTHLRRIRKITKFIRFNESFSKTESFLVIDTYCFEIKDALKRHLLFQKFLYSKRKRYLKNTIRI